MRMTSPSHPTEESRDGRFYCHLLRRVAFREPDRLESLLKRERALSIRVAVWTIYDRKNGEESDLPVFLQLLLQFKAFHFHFAFSLVFHDGGIGCAMNRWSRIRVGKVFETELTSWGTVPHAEEGLGLCDIAVGSTAMSAAVSSLL